MNSISSRRSIRKYKTDAVAPEMIEEIIKAGMLAPSAKNRQPWKYLVYTEESKMQILDEMEKGLIRERDGESILPESRFGIPDAFNTLKIMRQAPVLIMILNTNGISPFESVDTEDRITEICDTLSIGASVQNMLLTATEMGLGTLWIANTCFAYDELVDFIGTENQLVGAISIGYPDEFPKARPRKKFDSIIEYK